MRIPTQSPKEQRCDQLREERWDPASTEHSGFVMAGGDGSHWRWDEKKKKNQRWDANPHFLLLNAFQLTLAFCIICIIIPSI